MSAISEAPLTALGSYAAETFGLWSLRSSAARWRPSANSTDCTRRRRGGSCGDDNTNTAHRQATTSGEEPQHHEDHDLRLSY